MNVFDLLTDSSFMKSASGTAVFYLWGRWGKGYVIDSPERVESIRSALKKLYIWGAIGAAFGVRLSRLIGVPGGLLIPLLPGGLCYLKLTALLKGLPRSEEKFPASELRAAAIKSMSYSIMIMAEALFLGLFALGVVLCRDGERLLGAAIITISVCG